jgi:hypothetical protein
MIALVCCCALVEAAPSSKSSAISKGAETSWRGAIVAAAGLCSHLLGAGLASIDARMLSDICDHRKNGFSLFDAAARAPLKRVGMSVDGGECVAPPKKYTKAARAAPQRVATFPTHTPTKRATLFNHERAPQHTHTMAL